MKVSSLAFTSLFALAQFGTTTAFVQYDRRAFSFKSTKVTELHATASDAIATLSTSQTDTVNNLIASSIPDLEVKPGQSWAAADGVSIGGNPTTLDARDAPGPSNVAWLSNLCVSNKLSSLTIFNGPLTDVPHLISRCAVDDTTMKLYLDFRPRAYGAYEMKDAAGNYPGPETLGRASFEYSGNRKDYETKFANEALVAYINAAMTSFEGATASMDEMTESETLTRGPLTVSITMPLTDANVAAVAEARKKAVEFWIGWAQDDSHGHRPGAPINSQYVYDSKYRQNAYSALLPVYSNLFGAADGAKLAAADSGPLDEGYVGGGS